MFKRKFILSAIVLLVVSVSITIICDQIIKTKAKGKIYSVVDAIPYNKVGLVSGTSKHLTDGRLNLYYTNRITAAVELYQAGKIKFIIVSGDNSTVDYNEPQQNKAGLNQGRYRRL